MMRMVMKKMMMRKRKRKIFELKFVCFFDCVLFCFYSCLGKWNCQFYSMKIQYSPFYVSSFTFVEAKRVFVL